VKLIKLWQITYQQFYNLMKNKTKSFLITIFSSLIFLIVFEVFLYLENYRPDYKRYSNVFGEKNYLNNDNLLDIKKYNENIIVLGDSSTHGEVCASKNKDCVNMISKKINKKIFNFASPTLDNSDYLNQLIHLEKIRADVKKVLVFVHYNDMPISHIKCKNYEYLKNNNLDIFFPNKCKEILKTGIDTESNSRIKKIDNILEVSKVWWMIREAIFNTGLFNKYYHRSEWTTFFRNTESEEFKSLVADINFMKKIANRNSYEIHFTYFPYVNDIVLDNPNAKDFEILINNLSKHNIKMHDPWKYFVNNSPKKSLAWSLIDKHPNCVAHNLLADYIVSLDIL